MTLAKDKEFSDHSIRTRNYLMSLVDIGDPVNKKEFYSIYTKLSIGKHKKNNANRAWSSLIKNKFITEETSL